MPGSINHPLQQISSDIVYFYFDKNLKGPSGLSLTATHPILLIIYRFIGAIVIKTFI